MLHIRRAASRTEADVPKIKSALRTILLFTQSVALDRSRDLHPSPLDHPKELLVESASNIHTHNLHPEGDIFRCLELRL